MEVLTQVASALALLIGGVASFHTFYQAKQNKIVGMASNEVEANKQTTVNWDMITGRLNEQLDRMDQKQDRTDRRIDILLDALADSEDDINELEQHIWLQKPPPPPPRKKRIKEAMRELDRELELEDNNKE